MVMIVASTYENEIPRKSYTASKHRLARELTIYSRLLVSGQWQIELC